MASLSLYCRYCWSRDGSERGRKLGVLSEPAISQLSCSLQSIVPYSVRGAPPSSEPYPPLPGLPVGTHGQQSSSGLEPSLVTTSKRLPSPLFRLLRKPPFMSILLMIQSYARSLISADIASFPIIRLCLASSRPSKLLIQASLQY
jgi:hypothetical protein